MILSIFVTVIQNTYPHGKLQDTCLWHRRTGRMLLPEHHRGGCSPQTDVLDLLAARAGGGTPRVGVRRTDAQFPTGAGAAHRGGTGGTLTVQKEEKVLKCSKCSASYPLTHTYVPYYIVRACVRKTGLSILSTLSTAGSLKKDLIFCRLRK